MRKIILLLITFCFTNLIIAQSVDIDKSTGLVKVDDKDCFYLIKTNKTFLTTDFSLQNLNKEELAYLKSVDVNTLPWDERGNHQGQFLRMTFISTTNTLNIFPDAFDGIKQLAKRIAKAKLIVDNQIDPKAERIYVVSNNGKIFKEPTSPVQVVINNTTPNAGTIAAKISIKANNIYNNDELVGTFKKTTDSATNVLYLSVYNKDGVKAIIAKRQNNVKDADWEITVAATNKTNQVLYSEENPLEKLFKYLIEKSLL
jgi:hypothetical protein